MTNCWNDHHRNPKIALALVSFFLGQLGDGLNIFQGIYLVALGWNEGSVGIALSIMGLTALLVQTMAGDMIDKTLFDRRHLLSIASVFTAISASAILFLHKEEDNNNNNNNANNWVFDQVLMYSTKFIEGISSSFIGPCLAAITLATFGPDVFDEVMASNIFWGHVGCICSAVLAGIVSYLCYPNIQYCFLVIGLSALLAVVSVQYLPQGDALLGRGLRTKNGNKDAASSMVVMNHGEYVGADTVNNYYADRKYEKTTVSSDNYVHMKEVHLPPSQSSSAAMEPFQLAVVDDDEQQTQVSSYWSVFADRTTVVLCATGFFFHFANANILLVLGELMGGDNDDGSVKRSAIPLIASAIVLAQLTMSGATYVGDMLTKRGYGRKPLFLAGLVTLPIRCTLLILWKDAGDSWLLSTQILDGLGGGLFGLIHPYLVNDIAFGSGRFNVLMGLTASCFGLGATLSNLIGQIVVEKMGHVASLTGSLLLSIIPIVLFALCMPETLGQRGKLLLSIQDQSVPNSGKLIV